MKTELVKDMSFGDYLDVKACHKSALHHVKTAKHIKKFEKRDTDTDAMRFGRIFHETLLQPEKLGELEIYDKQEWIPKNDHPHGLGINEQKHFWKSWNTAYRIHYYKNDAEKESIEAMVKAIMANPLANELLSAKGDAEVALFWKDERTGLDCKTLIDKITENDIIIEVKTDVDPEPEKFGKKIYQMGYQIGAWFNREGFRAVTGRDIQAFIYIAIEKTDPFSVGVYMMNAHDFDSGEIYGVPMMIRYKLIKRGGLRDHNQDESGEFEVIPVQTPGWEMKVIDDAMGEIDAPMEEESEL